MCIAITSPIGVSIPTDDILKTCFRNNSDGAGFTFNTDDHKVQIVKGFMDFDSFVAALHEYDEKYCFKNRGVLLHLRITTHGKTSKSNCHPFPISSNDKHLKKLNFKSDYAVVHNGIISLTANKKSDLSDTMLFVRDYLSKISTNKGWFHNKNNIKLIEKLIGSKMAILNGEGEIIATSGFHKGNDGNYYSNHSYEDYSYDFYRYGFFDGWYDDYCIGEDNFQLPLMELKKGEAVYYEDGTVEEYDPSYHGTFKTYISEDNEIYTLFEDGDFGKEIPMSKLSFMGNGEIFDTFFSVCSKGVKPIKFRKDAVAVL